MYDLKLSPDVLEVYDLKLSPDVLEGYDLKLSPDVLEVYDLKFKPPLYSFPACAEPSILVAQSNCSAYNGTWYNRTCFSSVDTMADVYEEVVRLGNSTPPRIMVSPSDEYFQ